jgi:integrase/recombinase XerD
MVNECKPFLSWQIAVFLSNGRSLEAAQKMANHSDPRTTKLYDRRKELANLSEIERRIAFEWRL